MVFPVVVGKGKLLRSKGLDTKALGFAGSKTFGTGVPYLTYQSSGRRGTARPPSKDSPRRIDERGSPSTSSAGSERADIHGRKERTACDGRETRKEIPMLPQILMSVSAAITLIAGALHLGGTFFGKDLRPQDPELEARMKEVPLVESNRTRMWKAWIGFNAIMSLGLILFGVLYGYLSVFQFQMLLQVPLLLPGAIFLGSLVVLAKRYLYSLPAAVFAVALVLYVVGVALAVA
jgi:hypothetical protein